MNDEQTKKLEVSRHDTMEEVLGKFYGKGLSYVSSIIICERVEKVEGSKGETHIKSSDNDFFEINLIVLKVNALLVEYIKHGNVTVQLKTLKSLFYSTMLFVR